MHDLSVAYYPILGHVPILRTILSKEDLHPQLTYAEDRKYLVSQLRSAEMINQSILDLERVQALRSRLRGQLLLPDDTGYPEACRIYNGMIDRHPGLLVRCVNVAGGMAAVAHFG